MKQIRTVMVSPRKEPCIKWLDLSVAALDEAVSKGCGFDCHAKLKKLKKNVYLLHAEESDDLILEPNRRIGDEILSGVFYVVAAKEGVLTSLSEGQVKRYLAKFKHPEEFDEFEYLLYCLDKTCEELENLQIQEI